MKNSGFSLLEIVVVITIVGVMLGFAFPAYQGYIAKSRISSVVPLMQHYAQLGQEYYEVNLAFGNAAELGLNTVSGQDNTINNPQTINQYTNAQIVDKDMTALCYNNIRFTINSAKVGIAHDFDIEMMVRNVSGNYVITCGIPTDQDSTSYADVLQYLPSSCSDQTESSC